MFHGTRTNSTNSELPGSPQKTYEGVKLKQNKNVFVSPKLYCYLTINMCSVEGEESRKYPNSLKDNQGTGQLSCNNYHLILAFKIIEYNNITYYNITSLPLITDPKLSQTIVLITLARLPKH